MMMAASILLGVEARLAKTDAVLLFTVVAAMGGAGARLSRAARAAMPQPRLGHCWRFSGPRLPPAF